MSNKIVLNKLPKKISNISRRRFLAVIGLVLLVLGGGFIAYKVVQKQRAAGGGGTATASPTAVPVSATGQTLTFEYTADTTKDSGSLSLDVPTGVGWSTPQGIFGTAGYTTLSSIGGVLGNVEDNLDSPLADWHNTTHQSLSITAGTGPLIGIQQLTNDITQYMGAGETWYYNNSLSENWGQVNNAGDLRVGMFMTPDISITSGQLSWQDDNNADLASPEHTSPIPALTAGAGQYISTTLAGTGGVDVSGRNSYGIEYTSDIGAAQIKTAQIMPLFDPAETLTNWTSTANVSTSPNLGPKEGSRAITCSFTSSAVAGNGCYRSGPAFTIGPGTTVGMWLRPSINLVSGDINWIDSANSGLIFPSDTVSITVGGSGVFSAGTWTYVTVTAPNSGNLSIKSYGIKLATTKGTAFNLDIDAVGKVINPTSSLTNWNTDVGSAISLLANPAAKKEGTASLQTTLASQTTPGEFWYRDVTSEDWSGYTQVGFWIRSTINTNAGDLQFTYDDNTALASPIAAIDIGALTANTWSWQILNLTGARSVINSFGIKHTVDIGPATINTDYYLLGPGVATFNGNTINAIFLDLKTGDKVDVVYGSGGGASGADVPATPGDYTFTIKNMDDSSGTLTALTAGSPVVTVNAQPQINSFSDTPDPLIYGSDLTFEANWSDGNAGETVKLLACRTNLVSTSGTCPGGHWFASTAYSASNPISGTYTTQFADIATSPNNYYLFVCDVKAISNSCSAVSSGTFTVQDIILSLSVSNTSLSFGNLSHAGSRYATSIGGSDAEVESQTLTASVNSANGYSIAVKGATLTSGANTITPIGGVNTLPATDTEQFGMRAQVTSGAGTVAVPYNGAGFAWGATATTSDTFASTSAGDTSSTVYSIRYVANIEKKTEIGEYSTAVTFIMTASL